MRQVSGLTHGTPIAGLLGGVGGLLVARLVMAAFPVILPFIPELSEAAVDGRLLLFAALVSLASTVVFGVFPAWQVSRLSPTEILNDAARGSGGRSQSRARSALVVLQVALATALLIGAGLLLRTLGKLYDVDPGFDPEHLLTTSCVRPAEKYPGFDSRRTLYEELSERVAAIPGVEAVGLSDTLPLGGFRMNNTYPRSKRAPGNPRVEGRATGNAHSNPHPDGNQSDTRHGNAMREHP